MNKATGIYLLVGLTGIVIYGILDPASFPFPKCPFRSITGLMCPGCGSQRAVHQLLHGHFSHAFQLNVLLIPGLIYAIAGYGLAFFQPAAWPSIRQRWYSVKAAWISLAIILVFWVVRNVI